MIVTYVCMYVQANQNDVDKQIAHPQNILCYARGKPNMPSDIIATVPMAQYEYPTQNAIKPYSFLTTNSVVCPQVHLFITVASSGADHVIHSPPAYSHDLRSSSQHHTTSSQGGEYAMGDVVKITFPNPGNSCTLRLNIPWSLP